MATNLTGLAPLNITNANPDSSAVSPRVKPLKTLPRPSPALLRAVGEAIQDFDLIREGDRVLIGLSGGKDSMSLLHLLLDLQRRAPIKFDLAAATVDPQMAGYEPGSLAKWVTSLGISHYLQSYSLGRHAHGSLQGKSLCSFCSRMRRGKLQGLAREHGFNVIALGHHLDDAAETFLMNSFFGGKLRSMRAGYLNDDGDLRIIRPLIYAREHQAAANALKCGLPLVDDNCPSCDAKPTQRNAMKLLLAGLETSHPNLFGSLRTTLKPLLAETADKGSAASAPAEQSIKFIPPPNRRPTQQS